MWTSILSGLLGLSKQAIPFLKDVAVPFIRSNWPLLISLWPVAQQFVKAASAKDLTGKQKQEQVVSLLRKQAVERGLVTSEEEVSTSSLELLTLLAYRTVARKDTTPAVEPIEE